MHNALIYIMCLTIKTIMATAAECKTGGIFITLQRACPIHVKIIKLGHPQPPKVTPLYADNSATKGILTSFMIQKLSKASYICFY